MYKPTNTGIQGNYSLGMVVDSAGTLWANGHDPVTDEGGLVAFDGRAWRNWSTVDSAAPDEELRSLKLDATGNIWVGSQVGLLRFDGTAFTVYNRSNVPGFPCDTVHDVDIDPSGNVWFAMENFNDNNGGVGRFDGSNWTFWSRGNGHPFPDPWNPVRSIACGPGGEVYIGGMSIGVALYDSGAWTYLGNEHGGQVNDIVVDSTGVAWFAMPHALVSYDHGTWADHGSSGSTPVLGLGLRGAGGLWAGCPNGLFYHDSGTWTDMNWPGGDAYVMAESPDGSLWAGGIGGIAHYFGGSWTLYNAFNVGLTDRTVNGIDFDSRHNAWMSTVGGGLTRFDGEAWMGFNPYNGGMFPWPYPTDGVQAAVEDLRGRIWVATYTQGIVVWDGADWVEQYVAGEVIKDVVRDSTGVIWAYEDFSTRGLYRIENGNVQKFDYTNSPIMSYVQGISADAGGFVWVATLAELIRTDGTTWEIYNPALAGMPGTGRCWSPARAPDGALWLSVALNDEVTWTGLAHLDRRDTSWVLYDSTNSPLKAGGVSAVTSAGVLWHGYFRGDVYPFRGALLRFDGTDWTVYDRDNSPLPHEQIYDIGIDCNDNPWVSCASEGVAVVYDNPAAVEEISKPQVRGFKLAAFPNPFRGSTTIRFGASRTGRGNVTIVDAAGRLVRALAVPSNETSLRWDGRAQNGKVVPAGVYFVRIEAGRRSDAARLVLSH